MKCDCCQKDKDIEEIIATDLCADCYDVVVYGNEKKGNLIAGRRRKGRKKND